MKRSPIAFLAFRGDRLLIAAGNDASRIGASLTKGGLQTRSRHPLK